MRKNKLIIGGSESGKSFLARNIMLGFRYPVSLNGRSLSIEKLIDFALAMITSDTDLIVIDDVPLKTLLEIVKFFNHEELEVNVPCERMKKIKTPRIIITVEAMEDELPNELLVFDSWNVIECSIWHNKSNKNIFEADVIWD